MKGKGRLGGVYTREWRLEELSWLGLERMVLEFDNKDCVVCVGDKGGVRFTESCPRRGRPGSLEVLMVKRRPGPGPGLSWEGIVILLVLITLVLMGTILGLEERVDT